MNQVEIISFPHRERESSVILKRGSGFNEEDERILLSQIKEFLVESVDLYPGIDSWWQGKVLPGIRNGERICLAARIQGHLAAVSIGKRAKGSAKLCTLRVRDAFRGLGIGERLLQRTINELLSTKCQRVHYTISEDVLSQCGRFFKPYGFSLVSWKNDLYARGIEELVYAASSCRLTQTTTRVNAARDARNWELGYAPQSDALFHLSDCFERDFAACQQPKRLSSNFLFEKYCSRDFLTLLAAKRTRSSCVLKTKVK